MQLKLQKKIAIEIITLFSIGLVCLILSGMLLLNNLFIDWKEDFTVNKLNNSIHLKQNTANPLLKSYNDKYRIQLALANFDRNSPTPIDLIYPTSKDKVDENTRHQVEGIARFLSSIGKDGESYSHKYYKKYAEGGIGAREVQLYNLKFIRWAWNHKIDTGEGDTSILDSYNSVFQKYSTEIWSRLIDEVHEKDPNYTFGYIFKNIWPKNTLRYLSTNFNINTSHDFILFVNSNTINDNDEISYRRLGNLKVEIENEKKLINEIHTQSRIDYYTREKILDFYVNSFILILILVYVYKILRWSILTIRK